MRALLKSFRTDQRGNIAIMSAGGMILAVCCAALGVDIGTIAADRRKTQAATDLAAIVAASNLSNATNAAKAAVTSNNYPASALVGVELGTYTANSAVATQSRFVTPATGTANAARVSLQTATPLYFSHFFTGSNNFTIKTTATATTTAIASFSIGSRLASLNGGLLNSVLGSMLGTTLSLSVMDYNALLGARIDAFTFLSALATRVGLTGVTYDTLLNSNVKIGDVLAAALSAQQATNGSGTATTALSTISQASASVTTKIAPGKLIDAGPYANLIVGVKPKHGVSISLYDLLQATAGMANGTNQIATSVNLGLPGIASASLTATIGARPQGSGWIAVGTQGVSVHTAQTRVLLSIQLIGSGSASLVNLPVYVEVASGTATLNKVSCGYPNVNTSSVTLGVTPGIVDAWIGNVTVADLNNVTTKPNPGPAPLVNLLGIPIVTAKAHAGMGNTTPVSVNFSYSDITSQTKKTVNTTNFTSSLTGSLLGDLNISVLGLGLVIPGLGGLVTSIISGATSSIDQLLAATLASLGVGIGQADVWVSGIRCDGAVLVN
ncbi:TadG family pilus assembly protein [Tardiphaga sp. 42S5]|uniref:TadG family pilus assembly protein n=1 Tax=Tardiphaga sp. 42S5 TaxID=1404799 RepID=UPI002A5A7DF8|nr:pilus assembly protein TadG-related protein [Tardiphaga sp. 42S5]WPO41788.1 TadG family pilus assembly protein [Tardiphaga sp. 42S5]